MSNNDDLLKDLLKAHGLKRTPIRLEILRTFLDCDFALSAKDLMSRLSEDHDRVTVYRALNSFEENGILHRASEDHSGVKFAICSDHCPSETHADHHAHFVCENCQQTYCLDQVVIPDVKVNDGFSVDKVAFTLSGTCKHCAA